MARQSGSPRPNQKESNTPDSHAHDRLVFLFASFIVRRLLDRDCTIGTDTAAVGPADYYHHKER